MAGNIQQRCKIMSKINEVCYLLINGFDTSENSKHMKLPPGRKTR